MLIRCPSCAFGFELAEESLGVTTTATCPSCTRVIVMRDADVVPPGGDATMPLQTWTQRDLGPPDAEDNSTRPLGLSLPPGKRVSLALVTGPARGSLYRLSRPRVVIGREGGGAAIQLDDAEVSRTHAAVECYGARIMLRDLGSRNGTFVDEHKVDECVLVDGAEFRLGRTRLMVLMSDER